MPNTKLATTVVTLKLANGDVLLSFQDPNGTIKYMHSFTTSDFTSINTTTNGGSTGATQTFVYGENNLINDYPHDYNELTS